MIKITENQEEFYTVDIKSMDGDFKKFAYNLDFVKETRDFIYAESPNYGWIYKINKKTGEVFRDGKKMADTCEYNKY